MRRPVIAVAAHSIMWLCAGGPVAAQDRVTAGDRVRVTVSGVLDPAGGVQPPNPITGPLLEVTQRRLVLRYDGMPLRIAFPVVERVEVSRRLGSKELPASLVGFTVGAVSGYLWPSCQEDLLFGSDCDDSTGARIKAGLLIGVPGALVGFAIGRLFTEWGEWGDVPVESLRVGPGPLGSAGFGLQVRSR